MKTKIISYWYVLFDEEGMPSKPKQWNFENKPNIFDVLEIEAKNGLRSKYEYRGTIFQIGKKEDYVIHQFISEVYAEKRKQRRLNDS